MTNVFVLLRHVSNPHFNQYWIESYASIRKHFPNTHIKIIDNNSVQEYITPMELTNCEVIQATFPETRLFSPFYECLKLQGYSRAIIIHDGILFNEYVEFDTGTPVKFLWHFETHEYDNRESETAMIQSMNNNESLLNTYKQTWYGCMGCLTMIDLTFLRDLEFTYSFTNLVPLIRNQSSAIAFERVLAVLCYTAYPDLYKDPSFEGDIRNMKWGYTLDEHRLSPITNKPFVKLFGARK